MTRKKRKVKKNRGMKSNILDNIRQWQFPPEFRIVDVGIPLRATEVVEVKPHGGLSAETVEPAIAAGDSLLSNQLMAELATSLWYLKTKYFKRAWDDAETGDGDPRIRRALSRLNRSTDALKENGIEVHDPTNKRYPAGGEGMMRPIQLLPTAGLTFDVVSETVTPIIYRNQRLIQRGEVFVAVPKEEAAAAACSTITAKPADASADSIPSEAEVHTAAGASNADLNTSEAETAQAPASGTDIAGLETDKGDGHEDTRREPTGKDK